MEVRIYRVDIFTCYFELNIAEVRLIDNEYIRKADFKLLGGESDGTDMCRIPREIEITLTLNKLF